MFETIKNIFKKSKVKELMNSKDAAKERLHLVLMQDRANVSADFLDLMRREIVEVIKKYIDIDENAMDVRLTTEANEDGTQGVPSLYANIPIINIKEDIRKIGKVDKDDKLDSNPPKIEDNNEEINEQNNSIDNQEIDLKNDDDTDPKIENEISENTEEICEIIMQDNMDEKDGSEKEDDEKVPKEEPEENMNKNEINEDKLEDSDNKQEEIVENNQEAIESKQESEDNSSSKEKNEDIEKKENEE